MANPEHVVRLQQGVAEWNAWRKEDKTVAPDLESADLRGLDLSLLDLTAANLKAANLQKARLASTRLVKANLDHADLSGAALTKAILSHASLTLTNLGGADLTDAAIFATFFDRTNLTGTRFKGCHLPSIFVRVNLSVATDLELARHLGPSVIDIDTIYLSHGKIPETFLRFAGVPANFIAFAKSLATDPIEFYSCFISYSTKDQDFADRLFADLQAKGVRCWFAPRDAQRGRKLHEQIDEAIRMHEKLLLILSPHSMNSNWVKTEIANTRARERREGIRMLFPVSIVPHNAVREWKCFDADTGIDSAREIREYLIADFSNWKDHDSYQKEFDLLLRDLQSKRKIIAS